MLKNYVKVVIIKKDLINENLNYIIINKCSGKIERMKKMNKIEQAKTNFKEMLDRVLPIYKDQLKNNFDLDDDVKEKLTELYNRTNEDVLKLALAKYQAKLLKQEEKHDIGNLNVDVIVITKPNFTKNERLYLLSLYINKLVEYDFESLGLTSIDIIKKQHVFYRDIDDNKVYDTTDKYSTVDNTYSLKLGFSLMKTCIKDNQSTNKMKVYRRMIEE